MPEEYCPEGVHCSLAGDVKKCFACKEYKNAGCNWYRREWTNSGVS